MHACVKYGEAKAKLGFSYKSEYTPVINLKLSSSCELVNFKLITLFQRMVWKTRICFMVYEMLKNRLRYLDPELSLRPL